MGRSTRPTVGTARRRAGALVVTILVVLLLGVEPVPAAEAAEAAETAETAETAAAAPAQVDCPAYLFMGSRGSGQPKPGADGDQHRGLGREIDDLYTRLDQQVPDGRLGLWVNDYPAISVPAAGVAALIDLLTAASHDAALNLTRYAESVGAGVRKLEAAIEERLAACADTQLILAGYSQGGQVTLDTYQSLDAGQRARVAAVVSFGDPYFNGGSPAARGDFSPRRHGMLTFPSALRKRPELPDAGSGKVLSFCHQRDPVCQGLLPSFSMAQHLNYDSVGDAASDVAYTRRAAACVALRVGHPGAAGGPTARITPPARAVAGEPIELSAAQSTDPACEPLLYAWSIDGGAHQPAPPTGDPRRTVTLPAGSHTVDLRVTTNSGEEATQRLTLEVVAAGPDDGGPPGAPTGVVSTPADDGGSATLTWEPPARGPPPQWYSVATTDGFPLYVGRAEDGRSLTLPADTLPVTVVVAAHNALGQGPPSAPVAMAAGELGTAGDLDALWRAYGDAGGHWTGGDSTTSVALPDERVAWLFSDTFLGTVNADGSRPRDTPFVHNTLVVQEDDGRLGATLTGGTSSAPRSLVEVDGSDELHWVADGHVEGDSLRVLYNTYETTGAGPLDVGLTGTSLATFSLPDLELTDLVELPLGDTVAWGSAILDDGGYTYVYGSEDPGDGVRFAHVARVERGDLGAAWEFFDGTGWTDDEAASARLFRGVGTAYDVVSVGDRYALVTQDSNIVFSSAYVAYTADRPTGPFTGPLPLFDAPQEYPGKPVITYDARVHTAFSGRGGLTVSYNVNSLDPDDNYADASIYRPRFLDVPWPPAAPDPATVPGPPRTLTAANGAEGLVRLTWQPPATGPAPTGYRVYQRDVTAGQTTFSRYTNTWTGTSADLGLLRDGHTYELRVTAQNAQGEGPPSNTATLAVDHRPPPAPANLRAEATGRGLVRLDWDATSANVVHTVHQRDVTAGEADFTTVPFPNPSLTTLTVGPLTHGHEYEFQVTAGHGGGDSAPSNPARATAHWPPPPTPTGLTATSGADGDIELSWNAPADDVWYWVYQRDVTGGEVELTKLELPVTDADDVVHHVVDGAFLEDEHVYEFAVAATDQGGDSSLSDLAQARSQHPQPATPTGLAATAGDDGSIALTWDAVGDGAWYWVHMRDVTAGEAELTKLEYPVTSPAHTATGLQQDHVYEFAVASVTRGGDSGLSDRVQATAHHPRPPTPTGLAATARDDGSIALTWESVGEGAWYWIHMRDVTAGETELTRLEYPVTTAGHTATGLTHDHEYEFAVASVTPGGDSEPGDPVRATSRYPTPAAPTGLRATAGDGEVTLEWTASTTPGTWYWIYTRNVTAGEAELTRAAYPVTEPGSTRGWLANGDTYEFRVTAVNQAGESEPTATVSARPLPPRPGKPTGLTATAGTDGSITLAWTAPGPGVYYWVYLRDVTAGEDFQRLGLPLGEVTTHRVTGLRHDHRYEFQLAATNLAGDGPRSDTAAATAHYDRPPAPTGLRAASSGSGTVTLDWESAGEGLYYWVYERDVTAGQTTFTKSGLPTDRLTAQRGFLADGHTYEYKVTAENPGGEGPASATVQVVARADLPAPPTDLRATPGSGTVDLTWTASPTPDVWYWVYHRNVTRHGAWQRVEVPIDGTSHRLGGLTNGETYEIKVTSTSWAGDSAPSNVVTVTPRWPTPGTPTGLTATSIPGAVRLRWNASSTAGAWYWIEYRDVQTGQGWRRAGLPVAGATTHDFSGIPGHDHQFRVVATQAGVDSAPSNVATARPGAPSPPTGLTATAGVASVTLRWTASPTAGVWYWVEYRDTAIGQGWQRVAYPLTGGTTYTMSMLKGHRHEFRVRSTGVTGESTPSNVAAATPLPPAAPTGLTATPQPNKVALRWTASPTPGTWYWVEWRDATTGGGWQRAVYPVTGTSHTVTGLLGHTYQFRVRSIGLAGVSAPSAVVSARPLPPAAPSALTVTAAGNASVSLRWTASPTPDTWYRVYFRDVTAGEGWRASTYPTASTSITMGYLWNGHTYQFKVASLGSAGEGGATNVVSARPMPPLPAPPTGIGAATTGLVEAVQIGWHPSPTPYVTYRVYARDATANGTWVVRGHVGYSPFTVRNLRPGHTYQFFVRAVDYWGRESGNSAMVSARPASTPTVVEYNWWGYEVHMSRRATSSFVDLAHRIADGSEACGILGFLGIPGRVISLICGFAGNVYGAMGDAAAAYHRRGNCATMNVTWVGVPWVNEDRYGTENCY